MEVFGKMTKKEFSAIINYIKNRPEEAARLREALGISVNAGAASELDTSVPCAIGASATSLGTVTWVSASQLGVLIGLSSSAVRRKIGTVFNNVRQGSGDGIRGKAYQFDRDASLREWESYQARKFSAVF